MNLPSWVVLGLCLFNTVATSLSVWLMARWKTRVDEQQNLVESQAKFIEWCRFKIHDCYRGEYDHMFKRLG